jgi:hypothetical protein
LSGIAWGRQARIMRGRCVIDISQRRNNMAWTPQAVSDLINDVGNWFIGLIILFQIARGIRTMITGK